MTNDFSQTREDFLRKGSQVLESELDDQVDYALNLQKRCELKNIEILSNNLVANKDLPRNIKRDVEVWAENLRKILLGTVAYIEENKFSNVEQAITALEVGKYEQNRISALFSSQKKLSLSFESLNVAIELFSRVNEDLLARAREAQTSKRQVEATKLYLKNAVLVYELTSFLSSYIDQIGLLGIDDINSIKQEVLDDLEKNKAADEKLKQDLKAVRADTRDILMSDIENREKVRGLIKKKWSEFDQKIKSMEEGVSSAKRILPDLYAIRDSARNQVDVIQVIRTVQVIETNLEIVKNLTHIRNFSLAPLTPEDACNLLGIPVQELDSKDR